MEEVSSSAHVTILLLAVGAIALCGAVLLDNRKKREEEETAKKAKAKANYNIMYGHRTKRK